MYILYLQTEPLLKEINMHYILLIIPNWWVIKLSWLVCCGSSLLLIVGRVYYLFALRIMTHNVKGRKYFFFLVHHIDITDDVAYHDYKYTCTDDSKWWVMKHFLSVGCGSSHFNYTYIQCVRRNESNSYQYFESTKNCNDCGWFSPGLVSTIVINENSVSVHYLK